MILWADCEEHEMIRLKMLFVSLFLVTDRFSFEFDEFYFKRVCLLHCCMGAQDARVGFVDESSDGAGCLCRSRLRQATAVAGCLADLVLRIFVFTSGCLAHEKISVLPYPNLDKVLFYVRLLCMQMIGNESWFSLLQIGKANKLCKEALSNAKTAIPAFACYHIKAHPNKTSKTFVSN